MPLLVQTVQAGVLRSLVEALSGILVDTNLRFEPGVGLTITDLDFARVACVRVVLDASSFEVFECDRPYVVGLFIQHLNNVLKMTSTNDMLTFQIDDTRDTELVIRTENAEKNTRSQYKLFRMDVDEDNLEMPRGVDFNDVIYMPSVELQRIFRDLSQISDTVEVQSEPERLVFRATGDYCSAEREFHKKESDPNANARAFFVLKYLKLFLKASSVSSFAEIYLQKNYPLVLRFQVASLGTLQYFLAPKAEVADGEGDGDGDGAAMQT